MYGMVNKAIEDLVIENNVEPSIELLESRNAGQHHEIFKISW